MSSEFGYFDNYTSEHPVVIGEYAVTYYPNGDPTRVGQGNFAPYWQGSGNMTCDDGSLVVHS